MKHARAKLDQRLLHYSCVELVFRSKRRGSRPARSVAWRRPRLSTAGTLEEVSDLLGCTCQVPPRNKHTIQPRDVGSASAGEQLFGSDNFRDAHALALHDAAECCEVHARAYFRQAVH